jgi:hypothetical protein
MHCPVTDEQQAFSKVRKNAEPSDLRVTNRPGGSTARLAAAFRVRKPITTGKNSHRYQIMAYVTFNTQDSSARLRISNTRGHTTPMCRSRDGRGDSLETHTLNRRTINIYTTTDTMDTASINKQTSSCL